MRDLAHTARFIPKRNEYNTGTKIKLYIKSKISQHGIACWVSGWRAINHHEAILEIVRFKILTFQESINESKNGKSKEQAWSKCIEMMTLESRFCPQTLTSLLSIPASWDIKHYENNEYMCRKFHRPTKYSSVYLFHFSCHVPDSAIIRGERTISDLNNKTCQCQWATRVVWYDVALKTYLLCHILPLYRYLLWG